MSFPPLWPVVMELESPDVKRQSGTMAVIDAPYVARPVRAATLAVAGMGIIGVIDNVMPEVARHIGLAQFHFVRSLMALCLLPLILLWTGQSIRPVNAWGVVGRSTFMTLGMGIYFACVGFLPVAQVLAGVFTAPLFIMLATLMQGRRVDRGSAGLILLGFVGCLAVVQPDMGNLGWLAIGPLLAGFFYGMGGKVTRSWTGQENVWTLTACYLSLIGGMGGIALLVLDPAGTNYVTRGWAAMPPHIIGLCALQAVGALIAVGLLTRAYQLAAPAFVGAFEYTVLIIAAAIGFAVWGHALNALALAGVALILTSGAALAWRGDRSG
ncbi:MAG: DMT family transporter [Pseudomonadota bacterium]